MTKIRISRAAGLRRIAALALLAACLPSLRAGPFDQKFEDLAYDKVVAVRVAQVGKFDAKKGDYHRYILKSDWMTLGADSAAALGGLLQKFVAYEISARKGGGITDVSLCFDPGYAVRVETDSGPRDFLICLRCSQLYVYDEKGNNLGIHFGEHSNSELTEFYSEEFWAADAVRKKR